MITGHFEIICAGHDRGKLLRKGSIGLLFADDGEGRAKGRETANGKAGAPGAERGETALLLTGEEFRV